MEGVNNRKADDRIVAASGGTGGGVEGLQGRGGVPPSSTNHKTNSLIRLRVQENGSGSGKGFLIVIGTQESWNRIVAKLCTLVFGTKCDPSKAVIYLIPDGEEVTSSALLQDNDKLCIALGGEPFQRQPRNVPSWKESPHSEGHSSTSSSTAQPMKAYNLARHIRRDMDDLIRKNSHRNNHQHGHSHAPHSPLDRAASFAGMAPRLTPGMRRGWDSKKEASSGGLVSVAGSRVARVRASANVIRTSSDMHMRTNDVPPIRDIPRRRSSHRDIHHGMGLGGSFTTGVGVGGIMSAVGNGGGGGVRGKHAGRFLKRTMSELNETDAAITSIMVPAGYAATEGSGSHPFQHSAASHGEESGQTEHLPCIDSGRVVNVPANVSKPSGNKQDPTQLLRKTSASRKAGLTSRSGASVESTGTESSARSNESNSKRIPRSMKRKGSVILDAIGGVAVNAAKERFLKGIKKLRENKKKAKDVTSTESIESYIAQICNIYSYNDIRNKENDLIRKEKKTWAEYIRTLIFLPDTSYRLSWDILIMLLSMYYVIIVPVRVGWTYQYQLALWEQITDWIFDILFWVDIFINFRTAYSERGRTVTDTKKVFDHYLYGYFWMDLVASLPFDLIERLAGNDDSGAFRANKILRAFRLFKIFRVVRLERYFQKLESFGVIRINPGVIRFSKAFFIMLGIWHYVGCFYWFISVLEYNNVKDFVYCDIEPYMPCCIRRPDAKICFRNECMWYTGCKKQKVRDFSSFNTTKWIASLQAENSSSSSSSSSWNLPGLQNPREYDYLPVTTADKGFSNVNEWLPHPDLANTNLPSQYGHSFFWAVEVTTGVGDDISPHTELEIFYTIIAAIIGIFLYAIIIGSASAALQNMDHASNARKEMIDKVRDVLRYRNVPGFFQKIILDYYVHLFDNPTNEDVLEDLPLTLRLRLSLVLNRDLIDTIPIFRQLCADSFIRIVQRLQNATYLPGEYICRDEEFGNEMFFIKNGQVDLLYLKTDKIIITMKEGTYFGEMCLLDDTPRAHSVRAVDYVDLLVLERIDFEEICDESTEFYDVLKKKAERRQAERQKLITIKIQQATMNKGEKAIRHRHSLLEGIHAIAEATTAAVSPFKNMVTPASIAKRNSIGSSTVNAQQNSDRKEPDTEDKEQQKKRRRSLEKLDAILRKEGERAIQRRAGPTLLNLKKHRPSTLNTDTSRRKSVERAISQDGGVSRRRSFEFIDGAKRRSIDRLDRDRLLGVSGTTSVRGSKRFSAVEGSEGMTAATVAAASKASGGVGPSSTSSRMASSSVATSSKGGGGGGGGEALKRRTSMEEIDKILLQEEKGRRFREKRRDSFGSVASAAPDIDLGNLRL